ncbi:Uncharacterised protein [Fluoribacter dumoffii]|uniref:Uncharacterized protein n=2 Tax=Fluoribacter dumoffii TaxID=463 RepID=A0A377G6H3_9GAMM|nr:hypothetical protein Ldum_0180 [Fluoribacter dumoffii NY 23]STO20396.1 Uncharacterised protein [Fluoribacter dumoffii]
MYALIGPTNFDKSNTYLETEGRCYGNHKMVNDVRSRFLEGVPPDNVTQLLVPYDKTLFEGNPGVTKTVSFCIVQQSEDRVPVFLLPATEDLTAKMSSEQRKNHIQKMFNACYEKYLLDCTNKGITPVEQKYCTATTIGGTKTMWGGNHFTAMIKPPGDEQWQHVDPTSFGGPQWLNRKQCGGYSSMIEAEALMHYSSMTIKAAKEEEQQHSVVRSFRQFINNLAFKFNTWFAGNRNEVNRNSEYKEVPRGTFETTYAEMADFSAGRLARAFNYQEFIDLRINGKTPAMLESQAEATSKPSSLSSDDFDTETFSP